MSVAEHFARFSRLRSTHPAWRLLAADSAPLILSFLADLFAQTSEVAFSRAKVALDAELIRWKESGVEVQDSAASYLRQWIASGWLREQDDVLLCTSACDVALRFAKGLDRHDQSATASHLRVVQDAVRDLAIAMSPDADSRIRALEQQRQALAHEIEELKAGVVVQLSNSEAYERLREIYQLAAVLTGDFRRLEDEIRQMDHDLRVQMIQADSTRGEVLMTLLRRENVLADTDAGRAFEGFFHLLADDLRTTEFREQLRGILERPVAEQLQSEERLFLSRLVRELSRESERVLLVRRRAEENLRAYVESNEFRENRAVARLLAQLERGAINLREASVSPFCRTRLTLPSGRAELSSIDSLRLRLPDESLHIGNIEANGGVSELSDTVLEHLETVRILEVADEIIRLIASHGPMTLGDVIARRPLTSGIEELVACLRVAQAVNAPRDESTESLLVMGHDGTMLRATIPTYVLTPELLPQHIEDLAL
jgi:hypothetical protein